jgi:hypothetical protein
MYEKPIMTIFLNHELQEHIKLLHPHLCSYWMILRKIKDTKTWKRKCYIALCGELDFREVTDLHNTNYIANEYAEKHVKQVPYFLAYSARYLYKKDLKL